MAVGCEFLGMGCGQGLERSWFGALSGTEVTAGVIV